MLSEEGWLLFLRYFSLPVSLFKYKHCSVIKLQISLKNLTTRFNSTFRYVLNVVRKSTFNRVFQVLYLFYLIYFNTNTETDSIWKIQNLKMAANGDTMKCKSASIYIVFVVVHTCLARLPAFPGAEGFGKYATGGRDGEVYHVTNLKDSGPGSLRDAVSVSNRIIVFGVGGVINIGERIVVKKNSYIAGQTAPGGGITIYGNGVALNGDSGNNIIRYLRIRMGKNGDTKKDALAISEGQNYMLDNVSISWGIDGTLDVNGSGIDNLSVQDCIVGQGINIINHSTGGLMQSGKWSIIRSLYIDNKTRNPKARGIHECINSVFYNWQSNGYIMGDTEGISECNLIGNYFIYGPSSSSNSHITNTTAAFHVYGKDNQVDDNKNGVLDGTLMTSYKTATVMTSPFSHPGVNKLFAAKDALEYVTKNAGASMVRDDVDKFLIDELVSYGKKGKIITTEDENGISGNVGTVANGTIPEDTDKDGIPDIWEKKHGLNPNSINDYKGKDLSDEGYTNIEMYINELAGDPVIFKLKTALSQSNTVKHNRFRAWQNAGSLFLKIDSKTVVIIDAIDVSGRLIKSLYKGTPETNILKFDRLLHSGVCLLRVKCDDGQKIVPVAGVW